MRTRTKILLTALSCMALLAAAVAAASGAHDHAGHRHDLKDGEELHHFGYSYDHKRLLVPGLFSSRIHVFDVKGDGRKLALRSVNDRLAAKSGYVVPHG